MKATSRRWPLQSSATPQTMRQPAAAAAAVAETLDIPRLKVAMLASDVPPRVRVRSDPSGLSINEFVAVQTAALHSLHQRVRMHGYGVRCVVQVIESRNNTLASI